MGTWEPDFWIRCNFALRTVLFAAAILGLGGTPPLGAQTPDPLIQDKDTRFAVAVYGGILANNRWHEILARPGGVRREDSQVWVFSGSIRYWDSERFPLSLEAEAQIARHSGLQQHWEFNLLPIAVRWHGFPWNERIATSLAYGLGGSWATRSPEAERLLKGKGRNFLFYWYIEATAGPPGARWEALVRIHHRSGAFGLAGQQGTVGSDFICIGLRRKF